MGSCQCRKIVGPKNEKEKKSFQRLPNVYKAFTTVEKLIDFHDRYETCKLFQSRWREKDKHSGFVA